MKKTLILLFIASTIFSCSDDDLFSVVKINDFEPKEGDVGTLVTISGQNFDTQGGNEVWFGSKALGFSAEIVQASKNQLIVRVPEDAPSDYIWVECYHPKYILKASSHEKFTRLPLPRPN